MLRKILLGIATFVFAFAVLSVSVFRSSAVNFAFATPSPTNVLAAEIPEVDYQFPYPGRVSPDDILWSFKAMRDRIWYLVTQNPGKRAELALLFSDKRLILAKGLFEIKKPDIGLSTLAKGEKYLELAVNQEKIARDGGADTSEFLVNLATASLKHRQVIEEILVLAPEDAKPEIIKIGDYSKNAYKASRDALNSKGMTAPKDPFDGD